MSDKLTLTEWQKQNPDYTPQHIYGLTEDEYRYYTYSKYVNGIRHTVTLTVDTASETVLEEN